jgi:hypothetical protein
MADAASLRAAFATFLGGDRFQEFVRQGFLHGRLRFWQEKEWERFTNLHPEFAVGLQKLEIALRICQLHNQELLPDTVEVVRGCLNFADWYIKARNAQFPHAKTDPCSTEGTLFDADRIGVWYCPTCRSVKAEWEAHRQRKDTQ